MKKVHEPFPFYEFSGTEREIGRQIGEQFDTVFSCVGIPEDGKLYTVNNPCENPYKLYTLQQVMYL